MKETILYGVLVYPSDLEEYLQNILEEPDTYIGDFYLDSKTIVNNLIYHSTYGDEDDFYLFEEVLDRVRFPYNYYPNHLGENFVIYRLRDGIEDFGSCTPYAYFLEQKLLNKKLGLDRIIQMEYDWDNQVKLCLEHRVLRLLEE